LRLLSCELLLGDKILPCNILGAGFDTWEGGKSVPQIRLLVFFRGRSFVLVMHRWMLASHIPLKFLEVYVSINCNCDLEFHSPAVLNGLNC
jgi:hypothetical protein